MVSVSSLPSPSGGGRGATHGEVSGDVPAGRITLRRDVGEADDVRARLATDRITPVDEEHQEVLARQITTLEPSTDDRVVAGNVGARQRTGHPGPEDIPERVVTRRCAPGGDLGIDREL